MDITELEKVNLLNLLENANIGVVIHAKDTSVIYANPTALRLLRLSYSQIIGKDAIDPQWRFVDENNNILPVDEYPVYRVINDSQPLKNQILGVLDSHHDDISWFCVNGFQEGRKESEHSFIVISFLDITDKKSMFSFEDILHDCQDVVIVTEAEYIDRPLGPKIVYVNKAFEQLTGFRADEVLGETPRILQGQDTDKATLARVREALANKMPCKETILNYDKTGKPYWLEMHIIPLKNQFGEVTHFAAIERDVTSQKYYESILEQRNQELRTLKTELENVIRDRTEALRQNNLRLQRLAHEDFLTGLSNRKSFLEQSVQQIARAQRSKSVVGLAVLDIDNFKAINDSFGHDVGDEALKRVALVIKDSLRREDVVGRVGGEEFAICTLASSEKMIEEALQRLKESISEGCNGFEFSPVTVSIGLCCSRGSNCFDLDEVMKKADIALYQAKNDGKDRLCSVNNDIGNANN